jgi:hypothetical protein
MKQGRIFMALVLAAVLALSLAPAARTEAAPRKGSASSTTAPAAKSKATALHQFTGVVTALDRASLTVERAGKNARTLVFARHPEMKTTGELAKDAHVTVFYREESGHTVAHKVVVKTPAVTAER